MRAASAGLAVLCLAGWVFVRTAGATAAREATDAAETRASGYAASTVARVTAVGGDRLIIMRKTFADAVKRDVSGDATVARVRVWDPAGTLVASTDPADLVGKAVRAGPGLRAGLRGETESGDADTTFTPLQGGAATTDTLTQTFVPLSLRAAAKPAGAVEVDFLRSRLVSAWWATLSIVLVVAAAVFGLLFVVFMTRRVSPAPAPLKKVEPPGAAPKIGHDYRAATSRAAGGWVAPSGDSPPPPTSVAELDAAAARIVELEKALKRAAEENEQVRSQAATQEQDIERLRREAIEHAVALEQQVRADDPGIEALRMKLAEAESRAADAESLLSMAREELAAAHAQVGDTRLADDDPEASAAAEPLADPEPPAEPEPEPTDPTNLIAVLEAKVADAEERAQQAKEEAMQLSPEASDLRMRLARTAARKKMGSAG
jgi:hypothetical protein